MRDDATCQTQTDDGFLSADGSERTVATMMKPSEFTVTQEQEEDFPFPYWRVWRTVKALERDGLTCTTHDARYDITVQQVASILRLWGHTWAGQSKWQSLLNKPSLFHEAEESIVALHHLHEWMLTRRKDNDQPFIVVDVCCGKGLFSMLLSCMVGLFWKSGSSITRIVMLDRATSDKICWHHVLVSNQTAVDEKRPTMELWQGCNLHDYDTILDRLLNLDSPLALVGIHLCKMLGPSCVSLANGLGAKACPYLCLAPCCLPRVAVTKRTRSATATRSIPVNCYETPTQRHDRLHVMERRAKALQRGNCVCYLCKKGEHRVRECPHLPVDDPERAIALKQAKASTPCWKCGEMGHYKSDCPSTLASNKPQRSDPPFVPMNVDKVVESPQPFATYCQLLSETLQDCSSLQLMEPGLINSSSAHQEGNWNSERKSIYIVATRSQ